MLKVWRSFGSGSSAKRFPIRVPLGWFSRSSALSMMIALGTSLASVMWISSSCVMLSPSLSVTITKTLCIGMVSKSKEAVSPVVRVAPARPLAIRKRSLEYTTGSVFPSPDSGSTNSTVKDSRSSSSPIRIVPTMERPRASSEMELLSRVRLVGASG